MTKRRTRKQKEKAKHQFTVSWQPTKNTSDIKAGRPEPQKASSKAIVKGQLEKGAKTPKFQKAKKENAKDTAKPEELASIRRDIFKSIILASLILSLEVMIYLVSR